MTLKHPFTKKNILHSPSWKIARRILPTLIGLWIVGVFFQTKPQLAQQFAQQILEKLGLSVQTQTPTDFVQEVNTFRSTQNKKTLDRNATLDSLANILALSISQSQDQKPQISIEQAAKIANYRYSSIIYFTIISPQSGPSLSLQNWLTDNKDDLLSPEFTQIGSAVLLVTIDQSKQNINVVILAKPQSNTTSSSPSAPVSNTNTYYTGTQLWAEVQKYRVEHGVPQYKQDNTLCTIASIRLNQLIELGRLDNHEGFEPLVDQFRDDGRLAHTNIGENLLVGYATPKEAVAAWDSSPGHQALLRDGAYVFACTSANHGYAVLIAAF